MSTVGQAANRTSSEQVISPEDPSYDQARKVFCGTFDNRPALIARPNDPAWSPDGGHLA